LADKSDPEVQFFLDWQKKADSLVLDVEHVKQKHEYAKRYVSDARDLFKLLKDKHLEKFSVGVIDQAAYIQVFLEPTPQARKQTLEIVKAVLEARPKQPQTSIFIELLEPTEFHKQYQEIIPSGLWKTGAGIQGAQRILTLNFELGVNMDISELSRHWEVNTSATRNSQARERASQTVQTWAEKNLPKPSFIYPYGYISVETLVSEEPAVRFGFPYYDKEFTEAEKLSGDNEPKAYIVGTYYFDQKVFTKLRKQAEF